MAAILSFRRIRRGCPLLAPCHRRVVMSSPASLFLRFAPEINGLPVESPIRADFEGRKLTSLDVATNRIRMNIEVSGDFFERENHLRYCCLHPLCPYPSAYPRQDRPKCAYKLMRRRRSRQYAKCPIFARHLHGSVGSNLDSTRHSLRSGLLRTEQVKGIPHPRAARLS